MALTSDTNPSTNGVNCIERESAEILNDADLEDGEIFEEEEPGEEKSAPAIPQEKLKPIPPVEVVVPAVVKKPEEPPKIHKVFENDKPPRDQNVPFFNRGKRKHFDDEDDNRWKRDGKRNRRSHEFERDGEMGKTRQDGEMGEDDEEMMFVRGASPHRLDEEMDKWDRDGEEDDRGGDIPRSRPRTYRGRGGGMRRGDRQRGRGRGGRGSLRGNKRKREEMEMCHFFLQGKCHRGSDCPYAHEIRPPRKTELCKFYMKDCCAKKEKCLYMHSEFPCKYFHTGLKCYAYKKCKFSHGPLTDQMSKILANHLDTAPKDILGEFPRRDRDNRDMRDGRGDPRDRDMRDMRDMRDIRDMRGDFMRGKGDRDRKIPSLFDIKVTIPEDMRNTDGNHTPMPSPTQRSQDSTRSSERDREIYSPHKEKERDREREKEREPEKHKHDKHEKSKEERKEERKERKAKREKAREHRKERRERKEREKEKKRERSKDSLSENNDQVEQQSINVSEIMSPNQSEAMQSYQLADNIRSSIDGPLIMPMEKQPEDSDKRGAATEENGLTLQHLPKKQRELYLRIQQQQREAESSQASANDEDDEDDKMAEENWYSSDEETPSASVTNPPLSSAANAMPLPSILQGLTTGASSSGATTTTATTASSVGGDPVMLLNILASASAAAKPLDVPEPPAPAPTVPFIPPNLDFTNMQSVIEALTSLQKINSANKQAEQLTTPSAATTSRTDLGTEPPGHHDESTKPEPPRVRDPRLSRMDGGDVDLRQKVVKPAQMLSPQQDVDLRSLPFKPVQHTAASEIDASLASHSPLTWHLIPADIIKADYTSLQIQPRPGVNDPRLRRIARPPTDDLGLPRDPRQRLMDDPPPAPAPVRDPRARGPLLATPLMPPASMLGPPPTPRYDEDHRPQFYRMDSDMRQFPPPTPRMDEEVYTPGPSRPVDPRRKQFTPRPDDIDLRPMAQRVPFVNFK